MKTDNSMYKSLNNQFGAISLQQRLSLLERMYPNLVIASSFGLSTLVIIDMYYRRLKLRIPVIFLDTLYHFDETLATAERVCEKYSLDFRRYTPREAETREEFESLYGPNLWERDLQRFHELTKLRQMHEALADHDAWISGLRWDQSPERWGAAILHWDDKFGLYKLNPLADWTMDQVFEYIQTHEIPYNPLHDQGYLSIGDEPLTDPVGPFESMRAGRWRGLAKTECGLHV